MLARYDRICKMRKVGISGNDHGKANSADKPLGILKILGIYRAFYRDELMWLFHLNSPYYQSELIQKRASR